MIYYTLIGQTPVPIACDPCTPEGIQNLKEWADWFEEPGNRLVAQTTVMGMVWVSTMFMGLDHSFLRYANPELPPILFETMAFWGGSHSGGYEQTRCSTWLEAERQHGAMCRHVVKPASVAAWVMREWSEYWRRARTAWRHLWREQRGITESEIESLTRRMTEMLG